jgi:hypothetical protein
VTRECGVGGIRNKCVEGVILVGGWRKERVRKKGEERRGWVRQTFPFSAQTPSCLLMTLALCALAYFKFWRQNAFSLRALASVSSKNSRCHTHELELVIIF